MPRPSPTALLTILSVASCVVPGTVSADDWPRFRGPTGLGYTPERDLPLRWGGKDRENVVWESPLLGQGHASPIVTRGRVLVCTASWAEGVEDRAKVIPDHHVLCYDAGDGRLLWDVKVPPGPWLRTDFRSGPGGGYAAPTPASDGELAFCAFGSAVLAAVDLEGKMVWRRELDPYTFDVTLGSSPVLHGSTVILLCAMAKPSDSRVLALDRRTGEVRWETRLPGTGFGHSTPVTVEVDGRPQMLVLASGASETADALKCLDPETGKLLWWCRGSGDAASPAFGSGRVYFDSGRWGPGVCLEPGGTGDIGATRVRWTVPSVPEGIGSPTIVDGLVYRLHDPGVLKCWDLATGERVYQARLEGITTTWASPVADAAGRIWFASAGTSVVIQAGRELRVLETNDLGDPNHASAAVADGRLYLVGTRSVWCIGRKPPRPDTGGPPEAKTAR